MNQQYIFEEMKKSVSFHGIGIKEFSEGNFYAVFDINGTPFFIDNLFYSMNQGMLWNVEHSRIYHYTIPHEEESGKHVCKHCSYEYEDGKTMSEELLCDFYSKEPYITAIWGACVFSPHFQETLNDLIQQLNPKGLTYTVKEVEDEKR